MRVAAIPESLLLVNREHELYLASRINGGGIARARSVRGMIFYLQGLGSSGFVAVETLSPIQPGMPIQATEEKLIQGDGSGSWQSLRSERAPWISFVGGGAVSRDGSRFVVNLGGVLSIAAADGDTLDLTEVARLKGSPPNKYRLGWSRRLSSLKEMAIDNTGQLILISCTGHWEFRLPGAAKPLHMYGEYDPHPTLALLDLSRGILLRIPTSVDDEIRHIAFLKSGIVSIVYRCGMAETVRLGGSGMDVVTTRTSLVNLLIDDVRAGVTDEAGMAVAGTRQGVPGVVLFDWQWEPGPVWVETPRPVQAMTQDGVGTVVLALEGGKVVEITPAERSFQEWAILRDAGG